MNTNQNRNVLGFSEIPGGIFLVGGMLFLFLLCEIVPLVRYILPPVEIYNEWEQAYVIGTVASLCALIGLSLYGRGIIILKPYAGVIAGKGMNWILGGLSLMFIIAVFNLFEHHLMLKLGLIGDAYKSYSTWADILSNILTSLGYFIQFVGLTVLKKDPGFGTEVKKNIAFFQISTLMFPVLFWFSVLSFYFLAIFDFQADVYSLVDSVYNTLFILVFVSIFITGVIAWKHLASSFLENSEMTE